MQKSEKAEEPILRSCFTKGWTNEWKDKHSKINRTLLLARVSNKDFYLIWYLFNDCIILAQKHTELSHSHRSS